MDKRQKRAQKEKKRQAALRKARAAGPPVAAEDIHQICDRASAALRAGHHEKSEKILRQALRAYPDHPRALTNLVVVLERQGRHTNALAAARRCVAANPDLAHGHRSLSTLLKFRGEIDESVQVLRRALELEPENGEAWLSMAGMKRYTDPEDADITEMEALIERLALQHPERTALHFALGKALEDVSEYERSFQHYRSGNRRMRAGLSYSTAHTTSLVEATIASQGEEFLARGPAPGAPSEAPILVVGMPRSGSTLIEQILASHPDVGGVGEVTDLFETLQGVSPDWIERMQKIGELDGEELARLGKSYVTRLRRRAPDVPRIVDKTLNNFMNVGFLARALPAARIVHAVREPVDNCFAAYKVRFLDELNFTYDLGEAGDYYRLLREMMDHWKRHAPERILEVSYEALVADQEAETRRMLGFLGLAWDDACLRFFETPRRVTSASTSQVRSPIYRDSLARWRPYEAHLGPLIEALGPLAAGTTPGDG